MKKIKFDVNGKTQSGSAQLIGDQIWMHFGGRSFQVSATPEAQNGDRKTGSIAKLKSGNIIAPMPGKITKIMVKPGDHVEENQSILVMEAMKMEYALKAQISGTLKEMCFEVNAQVALGTTLAIIEKTKAL